MSGDRRFNPQEINLYAYCGNNPLVNTDPDGKYYVGQNGKRVKVTEKNGQIKVGKNAGADLKRMADLINRSGSASSISEFMKVANNVTKTHFQIETSPVNNDLLGYHQPHDKNGNALTWDPVSGKFDGTPAYIKDKSGNLVYKEATITIHEGNLTNEEMAVQQKKYADPALTKNEELVAINAHEDVHDTDQQGIDKIRERQQGGTNTFDPEAASEQAEGKAHDEIKANRSKKKPQE